MKRYQKGSLNHPSKSVKNTDTGDGIKYASVNAPAQSMEGRIKGYLYENTNKNTGSNTKNM